MTITKDIVDKAISSDSELSALGRSATFIPVYGNDVTDIGDSAFAECNALSSFKMSDELQRVGANAFERCISLSAVNFSDT